MRTEENSSVVELVGLLFPPDLYWFYVITPAAAGVNILTFDPRQ